MSFCRHILEIFHGAFIFETPIVVRVPTGFFLQFETLHLFDGVSGEMEADISLMKTPSPRDLCSPTAMRLWLSASLTSQHVSATDYPCDKLKRKRYSP